MKRNMFLKKLLLFMTVFALGAASQQKTVYAEAFDYIWAVTRGGAMKELLLIWNQ